MTGSHIDTQPTGGKFDGAYGVMAGLEAPPDGEHTLYSGTVRVRALVKYAEIFFGKEIRKVFSGKVQHNVEVQTPQAVHDLAKLSDEQLELAEKFHEIQQKRENEARQLEARGKRVEGSVDDAIDADFTEVEA